MHITKQINLINTGYVPYVPFKARKSAFWDFTWLHQDIYGGYDNFAAAVPGLGISAGVVNRATSGGDCRAGFGCEDQWNNFDTTITITPLTYFGYQALPRFVTHVPVVQVCASRGEKQMLCLEWSGVVWCGVVPSQAQAHLIKITVCAFAVCSFAVCSSKNVRWLLVLFALSSSCTSTTDWDFV